MCKRIPWAVETWEGSRMDFTIPVPSGTTRTRAAVSPDACQSQDKSGA